MSVCICLRWTALTTSNTINASTTYSDGCLGSRNDEERSEMRYVMRIAELVNHQIFERILRFRVFLGACLFQCLFTLLTLALLSMKRVGGGLWVSQRLFVQLLGFPK